jgi:hypothetical protein
MARSTVAAPKSVERFFEFSLLGMLVSGFLAVAGSGRLDLPTTLLTAVGLFLRGLLVAGVIRLPVSAMAVNLITLTYICFYPIDYLYLSGEFIPATVHLVFFLAVVRVLTARTNRDYFFVKMVAFLELLAASVLSTTSNFFVFLCLFLVFGVATFASSEIRRAVQVPRRMVRHGLTRFSWRLGALTTSVGLGILIMTAGLFFLLPRTARAALRHFVPQRYHLSGFSSDIVLGQTGELKLNSTPVMHIKIQDENPPRDLKWRGAALIAFDGRRWYNPIEPGYPLKTDRSGSVQLADYKESWRRGRTIGYEVRLQAIDSDVLFFTGVPEYLRIDLPSILRGRADNYRTGLGISDGLHYVAYSHLDRQSVAASYQSEPLDPYSHLLYTRLPILDGRIEVLARNVVAGATDPYSRARMIEHYLRTQYGYTTSLLSESVPDPLAYFLFERKKGHCEYFASAMAVMLRTLNVPARVVTGFQSGIYNDMTGWTVIRGADAHSWVEVFVPGRGWVMFDPTPADNGGALAGVTSKLMLYLDAVETFWQEWVLDYNLEHQLRLAARMEQSGHTWNLSWITRATDAMSAGFVQVKAAGGTLVIFVIIVVAGISVGPLAWRWLHRERQVRRITRGEVQPHDAAILYNRMLALLRRRGIEKPAWLTPMEFAAVVPRDASTIVYQFTAAYNELRFGGSPDAAARMISLLHDLSANARS